MSGSLQRRALDHVLALTAAAPCGESLLLRGSMVMLAWAGHRARPPGDIDFVVRPVDGVPVDDRSPFPYVERLDAARTWAEAVHGAARNRMWEFEDLDAGGFHPRLPPEGLHWVTDAELATADPVHQAVLDVIAESPRTPDGFVFDPYAAIVDSTWGYAYETEDGGGGVRVQLPWRFGDERGSVRLDFAYDEIVPEAPVLTAVPRDDGAPPTVVWSASRELSLAWKLQWMAADHAAGAGVAGKDLYDAVLLAEATGLRWPDRLRRKVSRAVPDPGAVRGWAVADDALPGGPTEWLERLAAALVGGR